MNELHPIFAAALRPFAPPQHIEALADALDAEQPQETDEVAE